MVIQKSASELSVYHPNGDSSSRPKRVVLYSHDTYGLGHLRRCLKISRALKALCPEVSILLITGSPHAGKYLLPEGVDFIKLPTVVKTSADEYIPRSLGGSFSDILELRQNIFLETIRTFRPDLMIVDHSPLGMKGEALKALLWLKEQHSRCHIVLGLRDIIDEPGSVIASWKAEGVYQVLDEIYDLILVYGAREVFDPVNSYDFGRPARSKTQYVGYIGSDNPDYGLVSHTEDGGRPKEVFLTVGGGEDGVEIVETYLEMLSRYRKRLDVRTTIVTGPYFPNPARSVLEATAKVLQVEFHEFLPDISFHLQKSDLVISMGGYNTVTEILSNARRAIIIPRTYPRKEQLIRAERLSEMGQVSYIPPGLLDTSNLYQTLSAMLNSYEQPLVTARNLGVIPLDGGLNVGVRCRPYLESGVKAS